MLLGDEAGDGITAVGGLMADEDDSFRSFCAGGREEAATVFVSVLTDRLTTLVGEEGEGGISSSSCIVSCSSSSAFISWSSSREPCSVISSSVVFGGGGDTDPGGVGDTCPAAAVFGPGDDDGWAVVVTEVMMKC